MNIKYLGKKYKNDLWTPFPQNNLLHISCDITHSLTFLNRIYQIHVPIPAEEMLERRLFGHLVSLVVLYYTFLSIDPQTLAL